MNRWRQTANRILYPPLWLTLALVPVSAGLLVLAFSPRFHDTALAYIAYGLSAYTLAAAVLRLIRFIRSASRGFWSLPLVKKIDQTAIGHLFLNDLAFRGAASIYQGIVFNTVYALFRGITAFIYRSVWFGAIAIYFLFLGGIRLLLARYVHRRRKLDDPMERDLYEYRGCRRCGYLMLLLNAAMSGMAVLMIRDNMHYEYPGYIIYLSAAYTFYIAITAAINVFRFRRLKAPLLIVSQALTFIGALMSVMALQTALIARFGGEDAVFRIVMNAGTGTVVCAASLLISGYVIAGAGRQIRRLEAPGGQGGT